MLYESEWEVKKYPQNCTVSCSMDVQFALDST